MKQFILLTFLCFFSFKCFPQCSLNIKADTDKFTKDIDFSNKKEIVLQKGSQKLTILLFKIKGHIIVFNADLTNGNIGCFNDDSKIIFLGEDNTTVTLNYNGKFNCQGNFISYLVEQFFQNGAGLDFLKTTKLKAIRVSAMSSIVDFDIDKVTSQRIYDVTNCLLQ